VQAVARRPFAAGGLCDPLGQPSKPRLGRHRHTWPSFALRRRRLQVLRAAVEDAANVLQRPGEDVPRGARGELVEPGPGGRAGPWLLGCNFQLAVLLQRGKDGGPEYGRAMPAVPRPPGAWPDFPGGRRSFSAGIARAGRRIIASAPPLGHRRILERTSVCLLASAPGRRLRKQIVNLLGAGAARRDSLGPSGLLALAVVGRRVESRRAFGGPTCQFAPQSVPWTRGVGGTEGPRATGL